MKTQKRILAFAGSNSIHSINQQLVEYAASLIHGPEIEVLWLPIFNSPIYSAEKERAGIPHSIKVLHQKIQAADGFIVASPEHNGLPPAFFKNTIDWLSRIDQKIFGQKPLLLLSTSPGKNGGATSLEILSKLIPWWGAKLVGRFSLASFEENFNVASGQIQHPAEAEKLKNLLCQLTHEVMAEPKTVKA